ncbi:GlsB/YeaQ/YmgE family stress response membrane protein [Pseudarthrobacter sp. AG30]|uniref:GlsB/YeaQ/YmgE family stress response membrane protein n=1 Tax=Micrococcaceae TaxID=1268 RepID=UPI000380225D|nr:MULTISPECIES: GlsB/YeaQ/YmgE family stress response membrane protein [Micrococcaceae]RAX17366.1 GlsB/YeaQ/YmgE family stress response membrane protein [Pseudarthrobacter sp. AG30]TDT75855.1 putative membrane protein YeaQ/YmgE (transglycosylase-associated protein family) [Arthrobacter sp. AG258]
MGFLAWIILGLIVGAIVKAVMPGRVGGGWVTSLILGVVGAIVGGWIGSLLFAKGDMGFFDLGTWILAIVGGLIVAGIYGFVTGRGKATRAP